LPKRSAPPSLFDIPCRVHYNVSMEIKEVFNTFRNDLDRVEAWIEDALQSDVALIPEIGHHLIGSGGKRFRPLLLLATAAMHGYGGKNHHPLSAVIEFIHTSTLLHDDVIDHAQVRRGRISANNIWGNAASVLVGDYLYSKAFKLMTEYGDLRIIQVLAEATNVMAEGEVFQLVKCGDLNLTEEEYLTIVEKKTAFLISAACTIGAILGDAPPSQVEALKHFGMNVGSAFQIIDDTLDYMARAETFGKAIGKDLDEGKLTLPLIRTLRLCDEGERVRVTRVIGNPERDSKAITDILGLIARYDGIGYTVKKAESYIAAGKTILASFPESAGRSALFAIADYVVARDM